MTVFRFSAKAKRQLGPLKPDTPAKNGIVRVIYWAYLGEDKSINPAPDISSIFGPAGPRRAPEAPGTDPVRQIVQVAHIVSPGDRIYGPCLGKW